ncbi:MAG TPA: alpha/beta hydrolase [Myxococcales bacterium]|nr:alpha/beta hydrolase [Myxococcales bacterium]
MTSEREREIIGPASSYYVSQRLRLHYVDWGNEDAPPLLLIHGNKDHARSWDWVARELRDEYHVIAPDLRGHGDSAWAIGGHYMLNEFVLDMAQLIETLKLHPLTIVAHSLGGAVALQYAAVYPERVQKLVAVEGLGPPPKMLEEHANLPPWKLIENWIGQVRGLSARQPRRYPNIDAAAQRMQEENSFLSPDQAHHLTVHGVARNEDGTFSWKFDNYTRAFFPQSFQFEQRLGMWERIDCPTLLMRGSESWATDPGTDGRADAFKNATLVKIEGAGHWVHHDRLAEFLDAVRKFLAED